MHRDRATNDPIAELPLHALHALHGGQIRRSSLLIPQQIFVRLILTAPDRISELGGVLVRWP